MDPFLEFFIGIAIWVVVILVIRFTIKVKFIAYIFATAFAAAMAAGYMYRAEVFPLLFIGDLVKWLVGDFANDKFIYDFLYLGIYTAICTFLWSIYAFGSFWMSRDDDGYRYEVTKGGETSVWSVMGWLSWRSALVSLAVGFVLSWCNCSYWDGFVYVLSGLQILLIWIFIFIGIRDRFFC